MSNISAFPLFYISLPGETRKEEVGHASATRRLTRAHLSKFEEKQETARGLLNILSWYILLILKYLAHFIHFFMSNF